jgi:hypothetical protein
MKAPRGTTKAGASRKNDMSSSPLAREALAVKQRQQKAAVTAAMGQSQGKEPAGSGVRTSAALVRTVEAAGLRRKKDKITGAMQKSQRDAKGPTPRSSDELQRVMEAGERLRKKAAVTAAMTKSQCRSDSGDM